MFSERCMKAKEFFEYLRSLENLPADLESVRVDLGVRIEKVNQSTDTDDLSLDIKNELDDPECQHGMMSFIFVSIDFVISFKLTFNELSQMKTT